MQLLIKHRTRYSYPEAVFLEPQYLNFYPQQRPHITVESFKLYISPEPDGQYSLLNTENGIQHQCWYNQLVNNFEINVEILVLSNAFNPFDFFVDLNGTSFGNETKELYLRILDPLSEEINKILIPYGNWKKQDYLKPVNELLQFIHDNFGHEVRYEEDIHTPSECFKLKNGSCRDLSWMMINMLRAIGIPSRFVSGYAFNPELGEGHELHAWVEVLVPGAGWLGVDPSAGIFVTEAYIPTAASHIPKATLPVSGTYRGSVPSKLESQVKIIQKN